jgi:TolA-binding protein
LEFIWNLVLGIWCLGIGVSPLFAQDNTRLVVLTKQIIEAKTDTELYPLFEELKDLYFFRPEIKSEGGITAHEAGKDNKYTEFVEFLKSLGQKKNTLEPFTNYYMALARYYQLKYLEEKQNWDEYFSQGNTYRGEMTTAAQKTINSTNVQESLHLYAKLILWQFHKDQEDAFAESALLDLMNTALGYARETQNTKPIKEVADKLSSYGEKGKSKELYQIYVQKLIGSVKEDKELENIALEFYKEENLELSEALYDAYIERVTKSYPKEQSMPILIDIAKLFSYKDEGPRDTYYAEKIFAKIEEIGSKSAFDEELIYLRAFNLEKGKEYPKAKDIYIDLVQRYPQTTYADEANFKVGIISTYVFRDIKTGRDYLEKLAQKETSGPQVILSLYHLGLLSQWENDLVKAREYYNKLLVKAKDDFLESVRLVKERIKEIEEQKPLEYNLKTFLDVSLKEEYKMFDMSKLDLKTSLCRPKKDQRINISASPYLAESGCMHVEIQYLWSGYLGTTKPSLQQSSFDTVYTQLGTKVINLVVVSPTGVMDRSIEMVDVY